METIKKTLIELATSKKALALLAGALVWLLAQAGVVATPEAILPLLGLIASYVLGQGIADAGKSAKKLEVAAVEGLESAKK